MPGIQGHADAVVHGQDEGLVPLPPVLDHRDVRRRLRGQRQYPFARHLRWNEREKNRLASERAIAGARAGIERPGGGIPGGRSGGLFSRESEGKSDLGREN